MPARRILHGMLLRHAASLCGLCLTHLPAASTLSGERRNIGSVISSFTRPLPIGQCTWGHGDKLLAPGKIFLSPLNNIGEIFSFYTVLILEKYGESGISISSAFFPWGRLKDGSFATIFMDGQRETREGASPSNQGEANPVSLRSSAPSKGRCGNMRSTHKKRRAAPHLPH